MELIKQTLFKIVVYKLQYDYTFFVEADNFEEALVIAKEVIKNYYEGYNIKSINANASLFKSTIK